LLAWSGEPIGLLQVETGWANWLLAAFGLASAAWCVRDALAWVRLHRGQTPS
jgi:hypothetical protein